MINLQLKDFQQQTVDFLLEKTTEQHKQQQQIIVKMYPTTKYEKHKNK